MTTCHWCRQWIYNGEEDLLVTMKVLMDLRIQGGKKGILNPKCKCWDEGCLVCYGITKEMCSSGLRFREEWERQAGLWDKAVVKLRSEGWWWVHHTVGQKQKDNGPQGQPVQRPGSLQRLLGPEHTFSNWRIDWSRDHACGRVGWRHGEDWWHTVKYAWPRSY